MQAIWIEKDEAGYHAALRQVDESLLHGEVLVGVDFSALNFKDSLALTGRSPIIRQFPLIPGVDLAGTVLESTEGTFKPGDKVVVNGWGIGELYHGGLAQKARLKSEWLVPLPAPLTTRQAMIIGTAGLTAMLCIMTLERLGVTPDKGEIAVTGASGGVGSFAIALLARLGYRVVAVTGKPQEKTYLTALGAENILDRHSLPQTSRPLEKERWAGVIDTVGSQTLAALIAQTQYYGAVVACGLAQGMDLHTTVMPFILRGVTLAGVETVYAAKETRVEAWERMARLLDPSQLDIMVQEINLAEAMTAAKQQMAGAIRGRFIVDVNR